LRIAVQRRVVLVRWPQLGAGTSVDANQPMFPWVMINRTHALSFSSPMLLNGVHGLITLSVL
jgi:hypothetical protein